MDLGIIIALMILGIVFLLAEMLIFPGVGITGLLGLASMGAACFFVFGLYGTKVGIIVTSASILLVILLLVFALRAKTWKRMSLDTKIESKALPNEEDRLSVGDKGKTITRLAPMGTARFGTQSVEVKALEGMMEPGVEIEVVMIEDNKVYVKPANDEY